MRPLAPLKFPLFHVVDPARDSTPSVPMLTVPSSTDGAPPSTVSVAPLTVRVAGRMEELPSLTELAAAAAVTTTDRGLGMTTSSSAVGTWSGFQLLAVCQLVVAAPASKVNVAAEAADAQAPHSIAAVSPAAA